MKRLLPLMAILAGCKVTGVEATETTKPGGIVVMGSSTALGAGASSRGDGWTGLLRRAMDTACPDLGLKVFGAYGYTTWHFVPASVPRPEGRYASDASVGIERVLAAKPSLVILQVNSNDPSNGFPPSETLANHRLFLDSLASHGIEAIVVGPFPRALVKGTPAQMATLRDSLTRLVDSSRRVEVWDSLALDSLRVKFDYTARDGVHLNNAGHAVVYRGVARAPAWNGICRRGSPVAGTEEP